MFLLLALLACSAEHVISFKPIFSSPNRPLFGTVCPSGTEFHALMSDHTLVTWNGTKASVQPVLDQTVYGVVCTPKGLVMLRTFNGTEYVGERVARGHIYWHGWGIVRPFLGAPQYVLIDSALYKSGQDEAIEEFDKSVYGCAISFHTGRIKCNTDPYSAMIYASMLSGFGPHPIRIMSMQEGNPAIVLYEKPDESPEHIESNIPADAEQVRSYGNALSQTYCSYLTREDGYDTYVIAQLESARREVNEL